MNNFCRLFPSPHFPFVFFLKLGHNFIMFIIACCLIINLPSIYFSISFAALLGIPGGVNTCFWILEKLPIYRALKVDRGFCLAKQA